MNSNTLYPVERIKLQNISAACLQMQAMPLGWQDGDLVEVSVQRVKGENVIVIKNMEGK